MSHVTYSRRVATSQEGGWVTAAGRSVRCVPRLRSQVHRCYPIRPNQTAARIAAERELTRIVCSCDDNGPVLCDPLLMPNGFGPWRQTTVTAALDRLRANADSNGPTQVALS